MTRKIRSKDVTVAMIAEMRAEAEAAGDVQMVKDCDLTNTNVDAFRRVLEALRDAAAQY